ncbi:Transposase [Thermomonospora echinospora]|uniref:Transposase n=1 Tax=Thermomonospora echinospora TaxID=1992 RepID=A0A1H6E2A7_9ACTN|nr:Transposase [Thermomonospora echinospora]
MRERFYPSDLTDEQWALIEPLLPAEHWDGRKEKWPRREIVDAIAYVNRTGCSWRQLPHDHPPWQTVYGYFRLWREEGLFTELSACCTAWCASPRADEPNHRPA